MEWGDLESPLDPVPAFPVEEADRSDESELARVTRFRAMMKRRAPQCRVVAIPNAGARGLKALNQARAEGAAWGFPDLMVLYCGRAAFIEFKNRNGKPKAHQVEWMNWLVGGGFPCGVFRTAEAACAWLAGHGFPVEANRGE
jgi:hypothetical protein